jgi:hypothetical protein
MMTLLQPVCEEHADTVLGIAIRRTAHGFGLFATRAFRNRQLIAPYVGHLFAGKRDRSGGRERIAFDLVCDEAAVRPGYRRPASPYAVEFSARQVVDGTCLRGWAGMANHGARPADRNAELVRYHVRHDGFVRAPCRGAKTAWQYKDRRHYIFPEVLEQIDPERLQTQRLSVWLKATRNIAAGQPILTDYTPRTPDGYAESDMARVVHRTVGSLFPFPRGKGSVTPADGGNGKETHKEEEEEETNAEPETDTDGGEAGYERFNAYDLEDYARGDGNPFPYGLPDVPYDD